MNSRTGRIAIVLITIISFASCATGRKPVRKNVRMDKNAITKRYGPNIVDTVIGSGTKEYTKPEARPVINDKKKQLIADLLPLERRQLAYSSFSGKAKMHYQG